MEWKTSDATLIFHLLDIITHPKHCFICQQCGRQPQIKLFEERKGKKTVSDLWALKSAIDRSSEAKKANTNMNQLSKLFMFTVPSFSRGYFYHHTHRALRTSRAFDSVHFSLSSDANRRKSLEMKLFVVFAAILVSGMVGNCCGQSHPMAWSREQRDQRVMKWSYATLSHF